MVVENGRNIDESFACFFVKYGMSRDNTDRCAWRGMTQIPNSVNAPGGNTMYKQDGLSSSWFDCAVDVFCVISWQSFSFRGIGPFCELEATTLISNVDGGGEYLSLERLELFIPIGSYFNMPMGNDVLGLLKV